VEVDSRVLVHFLRCSHVQLVKGDNPAMRVVNVEHGPGEYVVVNLFLGAAIFEDERDGIVAVQGQRRVRLDRSGLVGIRRQRLIRTLRIVGLGCIAGGRRRIVVAAVVRISKIAGNVTWIQVGTCDSVWRNVGPPIAPGAIIAWPGAQAGASASLTTALHAERPVAGIMGSACESTGAGTAETSVR